MADNVTPDPVNIKVEIKRLWETSNSVCGEMWIDDEFQCYTLEPARRNPVNVGHPCIPAGTYKVVLTMSPHLKYVTPELLNVPGRTDIRWHIANYPKDVLGCVAVGQTHSTDFVGKSVNAFHDMMAKLNLPGHVITAVYTDPAPSNVLTESV